MSSDVFYTAGYRIEKHSRCLSRNGEQIAVRPRSFALLLCLIRARGEICSKQSLLDEVWQDVIVDEQVLFQSIKELRQLLGDARLIHTHPRLGYSWTAKVSTQTKWPWLGAAAALAAFAVFLSWSVVKPTETIDIKDGSVLILPVKNTVASNELAWTRYGAMDQLTNMLRGSDNTFVRQTEVVIELSRLIQLPPDYQREQLLPLFQKTGAKALVELSLGGSIHEYQLIYSIHTEQQQQRAVIEAATIVEALQKTAKALAQKLDLKASDSADALVSDFSNQLFADGLDAMDRQDYHSAQQHFQALVSIETKNFSARRKLAESLYYQKHYDQALQHLGAAINAAKKEQSPALAGLYYWRAFIAFIKNEQEPVQQWIDAALTQAKQNNNRLFQALSSELQGQFYSRDKHYAAAQNAYRHALSFYGNVHCPIGRSRTYLHRSRNYLDSGDKLAAQQQLHQAKQLMSTYELSAMQNYYSHLHKRLQQL
ncbi:winged helix-turn-helix domain-containing protein [Agaribacterium haliotis]|uniref:winged helix-turn-helix domain-containing protein n=1 Tax=Agaribacterium haliotis TaxID=2013869 RepID=UPI00130455A9|nr:winged helix-turn-helix domain-containing protein [Agaribacterium haliotis]